MTECDTFFSILCNTPSPGLQGQALYPRDAFNRRIHFYPQNPPCFRLAARMARGRGRAKGADWKYCCGFFSRWSDFGGAEAANGGATTTSVGGRAKATRGAGKATARMKSLASLR